MSVAISNIKDIIVAVVSNPSFFSQNDSNNEKIKKVCDLIKEVDKTIKD